jgi:surface antigen
MTAEKDNVVFLKFRGSEVQDDMMTFIACRHCRNKTYTLVVDGHDYPLMRCAACGNHIGRMGWAPDDEAVEGTA